MLNEIYDLISRLDGTAIHAAFLLESSISIDVCRRNGPWITTLLIGRAYLGFYLLHRIIHECLLRFLLALALITVGAITHR